ncbi:related to PKR1 protein [Cephalotrichum gorgonifer]|uniref:Related to PKR1 protein n=1 Tax=Cephalotrichum gorgonifer TaxID=2041049 RepID=A0AAE8MVG6_9PEZI|nr:related to PKR1 protein [Cephalotrichum gorgonifer]
MDGQNHFNRQGGDSRTIGKNNAMASFITEVFESIFTPGPTPTLLKATNATFGALQVLLFLLLIATHSLHFVVLSFLCGGLWWAINWFSAELMLAQERERAAKQEASEDSETEVEASSQVPVAVEAEAEDAGKSGAVEVGDGTGDVRRRGVPAPGTQSSASTEDEWEKVSENENDKQK